MLSGIYKAQVTAVHPGGESTDRETLPYAGTLSVILHNMMQLGGVDAAPRFRVRMLRERAHPSAGIYRLPEVGDWGLVCFWENDAEAGVWLGSLDDDLRNLVPEELWAKDPYAEVHHWPSDRYAIFHGDGAEEHVWPDGSFLKVTTRKDGQPGNPSERSRLTPRRMRRKKQGGEGFESERQSYPGHAEPQVDVVFHHASGAEVRISADGSFWLTTALGISLRLFDDAEQARQNGQPEPPQAMSGPNSGLYLELPGSRARIAIIDEVQPRIVIEGAHVEVRSSRIQLGGDAGAPVACIGDAIVGEIPPNTVMTAAGTPNAAPIPVTGRIAGGSNKVTAE
ncbi:phage baseplate assembly protein V [Meiothermus sp. Pnk-1]|uniref:phage baseplate assembly protein V n=1 Tax=Meiothermus sp. Pnk-1 TaxID=873128 RepID=UPI000D7BA1EF|nr:phage baseplate assembly protein V [Meiothermus sp. Pnk-1]PZA08326.1 hypothetical protein DNA98_04095 [Meiothermus sp. Pnk-1]